MAATQASANTRSTTTSSSSNHSSSRSRLRKCSQTSSSSQLPLPTKGQRPPSQPNRLPSTLRNIVRTKTRPVSNPVDPHSSFFPLRARLATRRDLIRQRADEHSAVATQLQVLMTVPAAATATADEAARQVALERLEELVHDLDHADVFIKLGPSPPVRPYPRPPWVHPNSLRSVLERHQVGWACWHRI